MKRIIHMDDQVSPGVRQFAIWCTVNDRFEEVDGDYSWETADELQASFDTEIIRTQSDYQRRLLIDLRDRCVSLARGNGY